MTQSYCFSTGLSRLDEMADDGHLPMDSMAGRDVCLSLDSFCLWFSYIPAMMTHSIVLNQTISF